MSFPVFNLLVGTDADIPLEITYSGDYEYDYVYLRHVDSSVHS